MFSVGQTRPAWAFPARFAHGVTIQTSCEIRVVDEAMTGSRTQPALTVTARVTMPRRITVEPWSISACGILRSAVYQSDRSPATDLGLDQTCFLVFEGPGWVSSDASHRHRIGVGNRVLVYAPEA